ncbi:MAG: IreB family regulatory phosphoprotein [Clostridia bacterium]|nr:IreB family regulatory phosphoprotein [Clostridia bacterium]MCR5056769.1 IreB family regulatory phosphoprotein [Clostridia bacterium]
MDNSKQDRLKKTVYGGSARKDSSAARIIEQVYVCLRERGYNPINQFVGYIMSGDPTYITNYGGARAIITEAERDELLDEFVSFYLESLQNEHNNKG